MSTNEADKAPATSRRSTGDAALGESAPRSSAGTSPGRKILILSPWASRWSLGPGAGVSDDYHFIEILASLGHELHFLAPKSNEPSALPFDNVFVHTYWDFFRATAAWPTALKRILWPALFDIVVTPEALSLARRVKPDFVLGHSHYSAMATCAIRRLLGVPAGVKLFGVMDLVHTEWPRAKYYFKNIEQIIALKFPQDVWIILDDGTRGREAALRHGVLESKIRFLPNGINLEWADARYDRERIRGGMAIPPDAIVVLFLARLVPSKRPEAFIEAARRIEGRTRRPALFVIAGDGESREDCEALSRSSGTTDTVRFTGAVEHAKVPELMAASDIFVSTSRLTNVAIPTCEAMVCGLSVVGFDVGATREVIIHGETGLVVRDGDVGELVDAIARLADDDALRRHMGEAARERAKRIFTGWDARVRQELDIIEGLARKRATSPT